MKLELNINWVAVLVKCRILFIVSIFYILYSKVQPVIAFVWLAYFILSELAEIISDMEIAKEERAAAWTSISSKRKGF